MRGPYIAREVKAKYGVLCTEDARGLWIAKGKSPYGLPLEDLLDSEEVGLIQEVLAQGRGNRRGRFWVDPAIRRVRMVYGKRNRIKTVYY